MSIYQQFRPNNWEDVCGQEHVTTILKNQIKKDDISHAYLFVGTRGIGKTTIARIFGREVNRKYVDESFNLNNNLIEIDGASNNSVDNVRTIRQEVNHRPAIGKYKIYIIDECHQLSSGAFNALLKTLEEPPEHIIFCLATTEPQKIPATILSRCQRYDLKRFDIKGIYDRLKHVVDQTRINIDERALNHIAKLGKGSMRDALSILDQVRHLSDKVTLQNVLNILGYAGIENIVRIMDNIKTPNSLIKVIQDVYYSGIDLRQFVKELYNYCNECFLIKKLGEEGFNYTTFSAEYHDKLKEHSELVDLAMLEFLQKLASDIRYSDNEFYIIQCALLGFSNNLSVGGE